MLDDVIECQVIQNILATYEKASGQRVNFEKSAMLFSPNVDLVLRRELCQITGMKVVRHLGRYLGFPSHFSRNKTSDLNFIKERVQKTVSGWKRSFFSAGGKEILIKAVAQAIPTYAMSCIRFPKSLYADISQNVANFWWGSNRGSKRIHWFSWDKLCLPKASGGLGFRNLEGFNQALLAKQIWRILCVPDSFVARVLKGKYFANSNVLQASVGNKPSFVWRSLMWGRDLLCKGLRLRIGSGLLTSVFDDPWIPSDFCFRTITLKPIFGGDMKVHEFIGADGCWNIAKLNDFLWEEDVHKILTIPLGVSGGPDRWIWHFNPTGMFTTKSAYRLSQHGLVSESSIIDPAIEKWWKFLWKACIPSKVKLFMWRFYHNILPSLDNLHRKNIISSPWCFLCRKNRETMNHTFFGCQRAKSIWDAILPQVRSFGVSYSVSTSNFLVSAASSLNDGDFELFAVTCWALWIDRNSMFHGKKVFDVNLRAEWISKYLYDFRRSQKKVVVPAASNLLESPPVCSCWSPPLPCSLKINSDAACDPRGGRTGIGVVVRDEKGKMVIAKSSLKMGGLDPLSAEAYAMLVGLRSAIDFGLNNLWVESDSQLLVKAINEGGLDFAPQGSLLNDIRLSLERLMIRGVIFAPRSKNKVAHNLVAYALNSNMDNFWEANSPLWLFSLLESDTSDCSLPGHFSF